MPSSAMITVQAAKKHGPARGVAGDLDRAQAIAPVRHLRAVARQHEQGVVDAHAEPDQRRELRGEVRRVDHVGDQVDAPERRAEGEQRR